MFKGSDCTSKRNNVSNYRVGKIVAQKSLVLPMNLIIDRANIYCWSRYVGRSALTMSPSNRSTLTSPTVGLNSNSWRVDRQSARAGGSSSKRRPTLRASLSQNTATVCSCSAATLPGSQSPRDSPLKRTIALRQAYSEWSTLRRAHFPSNSLSRLTSSTSISFLSEETSLGTSVASSTGKFHCAAVRTKSSLQDSSSRIVWSLYGSCKKEWMLLAHLTAKKSSFAANS